MRVGFLYNHDALHQVRHTAPVVAEMARLPGIDTIVLASTPAAAAEVRALIGEEASCVRFEALKAGPVAEVLDLLLRSIAPFRRVAVLRRNRALFAALDVLVVPETTSLLLRDRFGLDTLKFVWIPHGAGDRSIGFRPVVRGFDLVLLAGRKVRDRMLAMDLITEARSAVTGYPKFDSVDPAAPAAPLFANDRPTVVYNPHFEPRLSSWYDLGLAVLDWFAGQDRYNLVFAPHVMLFRRRLHASVEHRQIRWRRDLPDRYRGVPHMLIDTGSPRSSDMRYTRAGDIYLGDVSSQIYEWIARPRPAVFLDAAGLEWRDSADFAHWHLGEVVDRVAALPDALDRAIANPSAFRVRQEAAFRDTFSIEAEPASRRAARAILDHFSAP